MARRHVIQGLMRVVVVIPDDPAVEFFGEGEGAVPVVGPDEVLFKRSHVALGVAVALRVGPGREDLLHAEDRAVHHEPLRCRLAAVIGDE